MLLTGVGKGGKYSAGLRGVWNFKAIMRRSHHEPGNFIDGKMAVKVAKWHPFVAPEAQVVDGKVVELGGRLGSGGSEESLCVFELLTPKQGTHMSL